MSSLCKSDLIEYDGVEDKKAVIRERPSLARKFLGIQVHTVDAMMPYLKGHLSRLHRSEWLVDRFLPLNGFQPCKSLKAQDGALMSCCVEVQRDLVE